jgi:hypothetical protein
LQKIGAFDLFLMNIEKIFKKIEKISKKTIIFSKSYCKKTVYILKYILYSA